MLVTLPPTLLQQCRERLKMFGFHPSFSRHGITRASSVLLIWLNENVHINLSIILIPPTGFLYYLLLLTGKNKYFCMDNK